MAENMSPEYSDEVLEDFCNEIVRCMVVYGGWDDSRSRALLMSTGLCDPTHLTTESSRAMLFHDYPYVQAMDLICGRDNPQWFNDPALGLWPPPPEAEEYWANYKYPYER